MRTEEEHCSRLKRCVFECRADYWKSQPRKFCQYCKCWIADNKPSVEFHERGKNHKENVAAKIQEIRKKSVTQAKQEKKRSKVFSAMEEAAMKAYEEDLRRLAAGPGEGSDSPSAAEAVPTPEPPSKKDKKPKIHSPMTSSTGGVRTDPTPSQGSRGEDSWIGGIAEDGTVYYYNTSTGESQWEKPSGFVGKGLPWRSGLMQNPPGSQWTEAVSPDGYTYYYNSQTGQSTWDKPEGYHRGEEISPPGVDSAPNVATKAPEASSNQPPHQSKEPPEPENSKTSSTPKISFRKRTSDEFQESVSTMEEKGLEEGETSGGTEAADEGTSGDLRVADPVIPPLKKDSVSVKRVRRSNPYGIWERIQKKPDPYECVDLQLPQHDWGTPQQEPPQIPEEPRVPIKFTERSVSLGEEFGIEVEFKRRKPLAGRSRNLRERDIDD
ncbi:hypothetical protein DNTS_003499 [Danionella cerebrum]|uniref:WW domain-containing protein n=1 Tax=Danionella cerebrum TaxID=2873325 RepID=A0A553MLH5_9TELE|nr:hypothetical protein DNTS_003499 [Danionella translucida]